MKDCPTPPFLELRFLENISTLRHITQSAGFLCLWLTATMSPTHHALAEVRNANQTLPPTKRKPSQSCQGWQATSQDQENGPPLRHGPPARPQANRSAALASTAIKSLSPSNPSPQIVAASSPPPISSSGIPTRPTAALTLTLPRRQQTRYLSVHDTHHPPETDPDGISHLWGRVALFNAELFSSTEHRVECERASFAPPGPRRRHANYRLDTQRVMAASANTSRVATDQQYSFVVEIEPEA